jgi:uncharacterized protein
MDRKGILSFLLITFGLTYAIEIPMILSGFTLTGTGGAAGQYLFLPIMFIPALGAVITAKFITKEGFQNMGLRFGPWKNYLIIGLLIPALFALIYLITALLGFGQPDWNLDTFIQIFTASGLEPPPMPDTRLVLLGVFFTTLTVGTLMNWLFCFGEELGWRGYLLPKLMPLGKTRAYLLIGLIWGAWHWPLIYVGFVYGQAVSPLSFIFFTALTTIFGAYLNELTLRNRSSILAGWAHGVFNTQKLGLWFLIFPTLTNPYLGGYAGLVGLIVWSGLALWTMRQPVTVEAPEARQNLA